MFENLRDLRERLANLRAATVADLSGIPGARLRDIEEGDAPSVFEIERLAAVYGMDADALWDEPIRVEEADAVGVLTSQEEFRLVSDTTRARMLRAASAARDLVSLRNLLGETAPPNVDRDETSPDVENFPLVEVPTERHGAVGEAAVRAWSRDLIPRDACSRFLGVTPGAEIERVADYFGVDLPVEPALTG